MVFYLDREGLFEEVTFETYGWKGAHQIWGKCAPSRRNNKCKSPEAGMCFLHSRETMKAVITGAM